MSNGILDPSQRVFTFSSIYFLSRHKCDYIMKRPNTSRQPDPGQEYSPKELQPRDKIRGWPLPRGSAPLTPIISLEPCGRRPKPRHLYLDPVSVVPGVLLCLSGQANTLRMKR
ncbi:hypothetical protein DPMN_042906 [Dreissena polymorpha]|uniref:Uncharacterized protein n=1 Tax=Dreissena polymorpha TaxID=45954 RepID=A0A9D4HXG1_DREPO|nr:hypothetical protein DPMN_042906 [Dreissena polymorpha]